MDRAARPRAALRPHTLRTAPALRPVFLLRPPPEGRMLPGYIGARTQLMKRPGGTGAPAPGNRVTNITNHLRLVNNIVVRVSVLGSRRRDFAPLPVQGSGVVRLAAEEAVNSALREAVSRELELMARGENVASNQRRRAMLSRFLAVPARMQVIRNFYPARMLPLPGSPVAGAGERQPFYGDIVTERLSVTEKTTHEEHVVRVTERDGSAAPPAKGADEIADRVLDKLERRLRLERGRHGIL